MKDSPILKPPKRGQRISVDHELLKEMIYEKGGQLTFVAKACGISYMTLYNYIDIECPEMHDYAKKAKTLAWHERIEASQSIVKKVSELVEDAPTAALAAAKLTLKTKAGKAYGWGDSATSDDDEKDTSDEDFIEKTKLNY